ncbi:uncharacterized protein LOC111701565 isoform X2 [Eurytemora carolleeae]|uniref:uncharacterized protein LOC111701565 isoform X2 n=1 Tax=Eurytemora carolleeae TaxID=1294199 RepID=UPI000C760C0D|nr:uncharacterized protein LOC111701565 isoform X2 [Eurytemora carolleeae]|eukprot:XP_023328674.1 uncharacterized protein LOC111701565 isoform X2 [Eurytemora affinis]
MEYAVILLLLKKRRKPRRTIDEGLKTLFNGDANQTRRKYGVGPERGESEPETEPNGIHLDVVDLSRPQDPAQPPPPPPPRPCSNTTQLLQLSSEGYYTAEYKGDTLSAHKRALCDNIDAWTMWLSPPIFLIFNLVYWIAYRHVETASLEG